MLCVNLSSEIYFNIPFIVTCTVYASCVSELGDLRATIIHCFMSHTSFVHDGVHSRVQYTTLDTKRQTQYTTS